MRAARITSLILAGLSLLLLWQVGSGSSVSVTWMPGIEPASLDLSAPGIYLALMAFWSLALTLNWHAGRSPPKPSPLALCGLSYLLCGVVVVALTADQFLARYVSAGLAVLCVIGVFVVQMAALPVRFPLWWRYLQFRVGDEGLMLAILLLQRSTGTFHVNDMLSGALHLSAAQQTPILLGAILSAWVKLGLPPFQGWLLDSRALPWQSRAWLASTAVPVLGVYLIYRLGPLIVTAGGIRALLVVCGLLILFGSVGRIADASKAPERESWGLIGHAAAGLILAGTPAMMPYLLTFIPARVGLCLLAARSADDYILAPVSPAVTPMGPGRWIVTPVRWAGELERSVLEGINRSVDRVARRIGAALQSWHSGLLRRNLLWVSLGLIGLLVVALTVSLH
jgi:hypothetical protein